MKFLFIVQGEGRGHLTQAITLEEMLLRNGHEVVEVLVGESSSRILPGFFNRNIQAPVKRFISPNFLPAADNKRANLKKSFIYNLVRIPEYFLSMCYIIQLIKDTGAEVVINFYELLTGLTYTLFRPSVPYVCVGHQYLFLHQNFEFPDKNLTLLYSATQASSRQRGKVIMGHDASMELGNTLTIKVDSDSTRYKKKIEEGIIQPDVPFYNYIPGSDDVDAITSATELYFAQRGLLYTYVNGQRYNTTYLHIREWLECIRQGLIPSCNIDRAFEEAMTAHMGTRAYLEGRTMYWDKEKEEIVRG